MYDRNVHKVWWNKKYTLYSKQVSYYIDSWKPKLSIFKLHNIMQLSTTPVQENVSSGWIGLKTFLITTIFIHNIFLNFLKIIVYVFICTNTIRNVPSRVYYCVGIGKLHFAKFIQTRYTRAYDFHFEIKIIIS